MNKKQILVLTVIILLSYCTTSTALIDLTGTITGGGGSFSGRYTDLDFSGTTGLSDGIDDGTLFNQDLNTTDSPVFSAITANLSGNAINWTDLYNVPSGFADGVDNDSGGSTNEVSKIILKKSTETEDIQTPQVIGWDAEEEKDTDFTHDNTTNNERITINSNGTYIITGNVNIVNTGGNRVTGYMDLRINGVADEDTRAKGYSRGSGYGDINLQVVTTKVLEDGDYIDLYCGIDDADQTNAVNTQTSQSEFIVVKVVGGPRGVDGVQGAPGPAGSPGDITWEGDWSAGLYTTNMSVAHEGSSYIALNDTTDEPPSDDWDLIASKGDTGPAGPMDNYTFCIWAEENSGIEASTYEWAFGNGADTPSGRGIPIYVPSGMTCTCVAMSLSINAGTATVELEINGVVQGANCDVTVSSGTSAVQSDFLPVSISNGDVVNFRTSAASGTSGPCQVCAWFNVEVA